ncbi:MAG: hypothetical protein IKW28_09730 [Lachnospiraceae bacterium]|nr:hypothetical protein [Lachnospiraceae bacterium]
MAKVKGLVHTTTYGNGMQKQSVYVHNPNYKGYVAPATEEERQVENKRLRGVKSKSNLLQRVLSCDTYRFFVTLTTDDLALALDGKKLLDCGAKFLRANGMEYARGDFFVVLETFDNHVKGYHLHALTSFPVNLVNWCACYGADATKDSIWENLGENWDIPEDLYNVWGTDWDAMGNLYCEKLRYLNCGINVGILRGLLYITKKIDETKERMEKENKKGIHIYRANVKKIKKIQM